jgi:hypothetical protein
MTTLPAPSSHDSSNPEQQQQQQQQNEQASSRSSTASPVWLQTSTQTANSPAAAGIYVPTAVLLASTHALRARIATETSLVAVQRLASSEPRAMTGWHCWYGMMVTSWWHMVCLTLQAWEGAPRRHKSRYQVVTVDCGEPRRAFPLEDGLLQ